MIGLDAQQDRRRALWNAKCRRGCPFSMCRCVVACECGHPEADHDYDYCSIAGESIGGCEIDGCNCGQFIAG